MANLAEQASKLLDFDQKLDITLLDSIVGCMYAGIGEQVNSRAFKTSKFHSSHRAPTDRVAPPRSNVWLETS